MSAPEPGATWLPLVLATLHGSLPPGAEKRVVLASGDDACAPSTIGDLVEGAGFAAREGEPGALVLVRRRTLPDVVGPGMGVLVCGLNPSLVAADAGYGYAGATNRFWAAASAAGLVTVPRDPPGALATDLVGMTDLVKRATPNADDLTVAEYRAGAQRVERLVRWLRPRTILFVGLGGFRAAVDARAGAGWQPGGFGGAAAYVMPSTSGRNAHARTADLVAHMAAAGAGPPGDDPGGAAPRNGTGRR